MTDTELMKTALTLHETKDSANREMHSTAADTADNIGSSDITKQTILRIKDYTYYRGRGWASPTDPIKRAPKGEEGEIEKFPDRVSPCFRRLQTIIADLRSANMLDMLDVYLDALKSEGITITINTDATPVISDTQRDGLKTAIETLSDYQRIICNTADELKDELGAEAEAINFSPKNKFKELVSLTYRKNNGKDIIETVQDKLLATEMYENGLNWLNPVNYTLNT